MKIIFIFIVTSIIFCCKESNNKKVIPLKEQLTFLKDTFLEKPEHDRQMSIRRKATTGQPEGIPVILLDFNGHTVSGTSWNVYGDIIAAPSGLNAAQQQEVIDTVIAHYTGLNVLVTKEENKYKKAPDFQRMRCIITTSYEWYSNSFAGVAYLNSFTWGDNTPCFVFSSLVNFNNKKIRDATSHEVGHTLGLRHQSLYDITCVKISDYNPGGNGIAPIMGISYYEPHAIWWIGPNNVSCTTIQNDTLIIKSKL